MDDSNQYVPKAYNLGDREIALTESTLVADLPVGVWAVFEKKDSKFYLRAIINLR